jgi:hypothetical protein
MPIRKKLTILLLVVTLAPLLLLGVLNMRSMRSLGTRLAEQNYDAALERDYALLTQTLHDTAGRVQQHLVLAEGSVTEQAAAVERALAGDSSAKVRWTIDFKRGRVNTVETPVYAYYGAEGAPVSFPVSFESPLIHLAPGVKWTRPYRSRARPFATTLAPDPPGRSGRLCASPFATTPHSMCAWKNSWTSWRQGEATGT